jgi:hypothetical protein
MPAYLAAQNELFVGDGLVLEAPAGEGTYVVVFEDDEETGYFYALDTASAGNPIQTALHIYDVDSVADKDKPSQVKIAWSEDHRKALLLINDYPHAVFDFEARQGQCRTGFPLPMHNGWSQTGQQWDDTALRHFA